MRVQGFVRKLFMARMAEFESVNISISGIDSKISSAFKIAKSSRLVDEAGRNGSNMNDWLVEGIKIAQHPFLVECINDVSVKIMDSFE